MTWTVKGQGEPIRLAEQLGAEIRGEPGATPDSWQATLHHVIAANVEQSVRLLGMALVSRDLHARRDGWLAPLREWRERVERERAIYDALPKRDQKGFTAEPEPKVGPEPLPLPIAAECSGNADVHGDTSFSLTVRLVED